MICLSASPVCLLTKASSTKSWLWHRRLNHLNFGTLNELARNNLVRGLPMLKYDKDHLCPSCQLVIKSINGKKYVLVIVDDYTRFGWVRFLRTKDETPQVIRSQCEDSRAFNATVRFVKKQIMERTYSRAPQQNGIFERRNQTLMEAARTMPHLAKAATVPIG
ncbi:retrovirus-related pol polyprotein from transposon TNT 1-94 [Tanacetum coccineum]|uniref:Retrovirus-related pol polyprotein from transposon TNT 1-94 n=1 Tax=Tanacetum coccineum TaxID=301880 RepID=A0ABQ5I7S3_9ASTR